jgi:hypothetical protein
MELYPCRFDSIHCHCHDDMNSILNILKNFGLSRTSATRSEKTCLSRTSPTVCAVHNGTFSMDLSLFCCCLLFIIVSYYSSCIAYVTSSYS